MPMFLVLLAGFTFWGFWSWLKIQQANQRILETPVDKLLVAHHHHDDASQYLEGAIIDTRYQLAEPDENVDQWVDEVKNQLLRSEEKDKDDNTDN